MAVADKKRRQDKKENGIRFERFRRHTKSQRTESRVAFAPRLDNFRYRDYTDNVILKKMGRSPMKNWSGLDVNQIHSLTRKPSLKGYWKYADRMSARGGISAVDHYAEVGRKYGWRQ